MMPVMLLGNNLNLNLKFKSLEVSDSESAGPAGGESARMIKPESRFPRLGTSSST